ncbi:DNA primase [Bacillus sp. FJAT-50079]|uniref:DNA primase n=1 Tax=Bacillus sp. FJAT-50079 TaxID=2833577 RepID=UPI001BC94755|nr:DNA primase [Bacillus sp. FJAT-50079]
MSARIPEEKINELRQSIDIVEVISNYVQLKKQGRNYFGLCPFHGENTPSFSVSTDKQIYHCFGCGAGGNVFTFLMEIDGVSFQEAARKVAELSNVELDIGPQQDQIVDAQIPPDERKMIEAHELLAKFYHHLLLNTNEGAPALEYLLDRGFSQDSLRKFQIGYSLPEWDFAVKFLEKRGFSRSMMERAGLIGKRDSDESYFDRFRNRIMFPLHNAKGRVIAFSARAIEKEDQPKYLNTSETALFNKSSLLYNLHEARSHIRKQNFAVLFEGFADVISADSAGIKNGVAVMGTALTAKHAGQLRRLTDSITICFDADAAGSDAAFRAGQMLVDQGFTVTIAMMPTGLDPDDYIRNFGAEKFRTDIIGNGLTWMAYKLYYFRLGKNLQNEGDKLKYIEQILIEIGKLTNPIEKDLYIRQLADEFSLSIDALHSQLNQFERVNKKEANDQKVDQMPVQAAPQTRSNQLLPAHLAAERQLIARMIYDDEIAYRVIEMLGDTSFYYDEHQAILTYLFGYYEQGNRPDPSMFVHFLPDKRLRAIVTEIDMLSADIEFNEQELRDYVGHVLKHPKLLMIKEKQAEQKAAERKNDYVKALQIAKEIIELRRSL